MAGHTDNAVVINAPIDQVWQVMNDLEHWTDVFTEYAKVEILEHNGNTYLFRLTTVPDEKFNGQVWSWTSERTLYPEEHRVEAHRVDTGNYQYMNIEWRFTPENGGTNMRWIQDFTMKPTAPLDDPGAEQYLNDNTRKQMQAIKERLEARLGNQ